MAKVPHAHETSKIDRYAKINYDIIVLVHIISKLMFSSLFTWPVRSEIENYIFAVSFLR